MNKLLLTLCFVPLTFFGQTSIWYDDFSDPSNWVIDHDPVDCSLDWQIGNNSCLGSYHFYFLLYLYLK